MLKPYLFFCLALLSINSFAQDCGLKFKITDDDIEIRVPETDLYSISLWSRTSEIFTYVCNNFQGVDCDNNIFLRDLNTGDYTLIFYTYENERDFGFFYNCKFLYDFSVDSDKCDLAGKPCLAGDVCGINAFYDENCECEWEIDKNCCKDEFKSCDDGNPCTINDRINENCQCVGESIGSCCPGSPCDDGNKCTTNDRWTADCDCIGTVVENCGDCAFEGRRCDDADPCTINDKFDENCNCVGERNCVSDCDKIGRACNDGDPNSTDDKYNAYCECAGTYAPGVKVNNCAERAYFPCNDNNPCTQFDYIDPNTCECTGYKIDGCDDACKGVQYGFGDLSINFTLSNASRVGIITMYDRSPEYVGVTICNTWQGKPCAPSMVHNVSKPGLYDVAITYTDGFSDACFFTVDIEDFESLELQAAPATGEFKSSTATEFTATPNPFGNEINLSFEAPELVSNINIFDMTGKQLFALQVLDNMTINTGNWANGVYLIQAIYTDGTQQVKRMIK